MIGVLCMLLADVAHAERTLTVDEAVSLAVERNPLVASQELTETIAAIGASRARLDRYTARVDIDGGLQAGVTKPWDAPAYDDTSASWAGRATLAVPLYAGGAVQANIDRAQAGAASASVEVALTERDLARAAYTAYWTIKGFELQIAATEEGLRAAVEAAQIIVDKEKVGLSAGIDVNRSRVDVLSQQETLIAQRAARESAEIELARLLHLTGEDLVLTTAPPDGVSEAAVQVAEGDPLAQRPELRRQSLSIALAEADVRLAQSQALPTLSVVAGFGLGAAAAGGGQGLELPTLGVSVPPADFDAAQIAKPTMDASIGLQLTWTPFDLLRTRQAVRQARFGVQRVEAQNAFERDRLEADIHNARVQLEALRGRYPMVHERLVLARDNQTILQDLYAQGSVTILDLFNAQSSFRAAAIQEASLTVDLATAELDLAWLLGADLAGAQP